MDLKYDILQFEDDSGYIISIKKLLEDYLDDLGFNLQLHVEEDGNKLSKLIEDDDWDLILMDYNLKSNTKGDELINRIRDHELYTEIIFYSEDSTFEDEIRSKLVEGVYFVRGRDKLVEKVMKIINLTLKKSQDVNNMRGLVIAEAIDIEAKMEGLIFTYFGLDEEKNNVFQNIIIDHEFYGTSTTKKFRLINKICKERIASLNRMSKGLPNSQVDDFRKLYEEFKNIEHEIIEIRNILAHVKESEEKNNTLISTSKNKTIINVDDEWCRNTRKNIIKHSENLDMLIQHLIKK